MPKISVIMPAFNSATTIKRAVRSILDQTLLDLELIVVDDGSQDDTLTVLSEIEDSRLLVEARPHAGVAATANAAAGLARAPLIARMDADDFAYPARLERQLTLIHSQDLDVVGCRVRIVDQAGVEVPSLARYARWLNEETPDHNRIYGLRFVEMPIANPTILAKRKYFQLGCRANELPEDYELLLRAAEAGMRFGKTAEVLLDWCDHGRRLTRTDERYSSDAFLCCRRQYLLAGPLRDVERVDLWGAGKTGKPWLAWLPSEGRAVRRCYDVDSRKLGQRIHGVRISHPSELSPPDGTPLLIAVGSAGARDVIRPQLVERGYRIGEDAWFVA